MLCSPFDADSLFDDLASSFGKLSLHKRLTLLDQKLQQAHEADPTSMNVCKQRIKKEGYCLKDCKPYGSDLKQHLRKGNTVSRERAKKFKYVKKCLVVL